MAASAESFAQFCQTYGPHEKKDNTTMYHHNQKSDDMAPILPDREEGSTFWNHVFSSYLPVVLLWVKSSMFGTANMVRSLILGNFLLLLLNQFNPPESVRESAWWNTIGAALGANVKADPQAWPPPALSILAILTVVALIIHPDGFTWIIWRKIRECIVESLRTAIFCWNVMVHDYGIIPTLLASATFATLMFLAVIVHKTLSPRKERDDSPRNERKKKKRRNHHHARTGGNRIRGNQSVQQNNSRTSKQPEDTAKLDSATATRLSPLLPPPGFSVSPAPQLEERDSNMSSELSINSTKHPQLLPRHRLPSASTIDTTTLTDDQSCESVRSSPLAHVTISSVPSFDPPTTTESTPIIENKVSRWSQLESSLDRDHNIVQPNRVRGKKWSKDTRTLPSTAAGKPSSEQWDSQRPNRRTGHGRRGSGNHNIVHPHRNNRRSNHSVTSYHPANASMEEQPNHSPVSSQLAVLPPRSPDYAGHQYANQESLSLLLGVEGPTGTPTMPTLSSPSSPDSLGYSYPNGQWNPSVGASRPMIRPPPGLTREGVDPAPLVSRPSTFLTESPPATASFLPRRDEGLFPSISNSNDASLEATTPSFYPATFMPSYHPFSCPSPVSDSATAFGHVPPIVKENPFEDNDDSDEMESRIEAELQELGGQMAGSILDF